MLRQPTTVFFASLRCTLIYSLFRVPYLSEKRYTTNFKTADAIHAATAFRVNCTKFITNDKGFHRGPRLPVVILSEVLAY